MSEVTVPQTLSGEEVIHVICQKVAGMLKQDCYLSPMMAYESFSGKIHIEIRAKDNGIINEVDQTVPVESDPPLIDDEGTNLEMADAILYDRPPNDVRQDAELPIPTLVETQDGRKEIRPVKYGKKIVSAVREAFTLPPDLKI